MRLTDRAALTTAALAATGALALTAAPASAQLVFNNTFNGGNAQLRQAAVDAGNLWSDIFDDDITLNITFNFQNLGGGLAFAQSPSVGATYADVRNALFADFSSDDDLSALMTLPTGNSVGFFTNKNGSRTFDNNNTANNFFLDVNRANAKALGLLSGTNAASDGSITLNDQFPYDFNRSNGINFNQFDVVAVLAHEIGHVMGFVSFTDILDNGFSSVDNNRELKTLDLFRRKPGSSEVDVTPGGDPFLSVDRGVTRLGNSSSGGNIGDGFQASHWENRGPGSGNNLPPIGIMDPQISNGELDQIRAADITAFDIIGFDVIPEPTTLGLAALGGLALLRRRR